MVVVVLEVEERAAQFRRSRAVTFERKLRIGNNLRFSHDLGLISQIMIGYTFSTWLLNSTDLDRRLANNSGSHAYRGSTQARLST
jgi:hypothetical protein